MWYTNSAGSKYKAYEYEYTASGQVHKFVDYTNGKTTVYRYDSNDRLLGFNEYDTADSYHDFATDIYYNDKGQLQSVNYDLSFMNGSALDTREWYYSYFYETDGRLDETYIRTIVLMCRFRCKKLYIAKRSGLSVLTVFLFGFIIK